MFIEITLMGSLGETQKKVVKKSAIDEVRQGDDYHLGCIIVLDENVVRVQNTYREMKKLLNIH